MVGVGVKLWLPKFSMQNRQQRSQRQQFPPVEDSGRGNKTELFSFSAGNYCQDQMLRGKAGLLKESFSVQEFFFLKGEFFCYRRVSNFTAVKICSGYCL